ncbi:MAG: metal-dependent hydrolase [Leptolyngbya sp. SIO4C1]|nr:metal-dependent hydrolase [Leptolyngbya sp. SIO4C1]
MVLSRWLRQRWLWVTGAIAAVLVSMTLLAAPAPAQEASNYTLTWYGQSAFKIANTETGQTLLIDPWIQNPGNPNGEADLAALEEVDYILVTHGHFDHVGDAVAIAQKTDAQLVSTFDLGKAMVDAAGYPESLVTFDTQGNFGGSIPLFEGAVTVTFVPAVHSSAIASDGSPAQYAGNPGGFVIELQDGPTLYHTGDTDLFVDMSIIPQFFDIDIMMACIGGQFTMGPERAATAVLAVEPEQVIPMHYGLFELPGTPAAFEQALQAVGSEAALTVMTVGEEMAI